MLLNTDEALACGAVSLPHRVHDVHGKGSLYCNGPNSHGLQELDLVLVVLLLHVGLDDGHAGPSSCGLWPMPRAERLLILVMTAAAT